MSETPTSTPDSQKEEEILRAAAARRIVTGTPSKPDYAARRAGVAVGAGLLLVGGLAAAQNINNEIRHDERVAAASAEYQHDQDILTEIETEALKPVDPANVIGIFDIEDGTTLNQASIDIAEVQSTYTEADKAVKNWIDFTLLESALAQGSYDVGDTFVVSQAEIDGKQTLIVQNGDGLEKTSN